MSTFNLSGMQWQQVVLADARKLLKEPFFWFIMVSPLLLGWGCHHLLPYLDSRFPGLELSSYYPVIVALLILTPPVYYGFVLALMVLEEKDQEALLAVAVTPISLGSFLFTRIAMFTLISVPLIFVVHEIIGVVTIGRLELLLVAVSASLSAPLIVMLLVAYCQNQLEGFVMGKGMGFIVLFPLAMFFVSDYWHVLCGVLPTYWPIIAYFTAASADGSEAFFHIAVVTGAVFQTAAAYWLYRRLTRRLSVDL
jgi:fluoroquinolone transport system permease protein